MASRSEKKKKDAESRGGSLGGALLLGALSASLGLLLGIGHLASIPVETVRNQPAEEDREAHTVYYATGQARGGGGFRVKEEELLAGGAMHIGLTEGELNTWSRDQFRFDAEDPSVSRGFITVLPAAPRFKIEDGGFQLGMNLQVSAFGYEKDMVYQARGGFRRNGTYVFEPDSVYLGSARIPKLIIGSLLEGFLQRPFETSEAWNEIRSAWSGLDEVAVEGDSLVLIRH